MFDAMNNRLARVCEVLKRELGMIIRRELEFENTLVTVSGVDITPDLKQAHVFISALGSPAGRRKAMESLEEHRVMFQTELSRRVHIKHTPHLHFRLDEAIERGSRIITLMDELGLTEEKSNDETKF
jgi:ribosome-binding factor A